MISSSEENKNIPLYPILPNTIEEDSNLLYIQKSFTVFIWTIIQLPFSIDIVLKNNIGILDDYTNQNVCVPEYIDEVRGDRLTEIFLKKCKKIF